MGFLAMILGPLMRMLYQMIPNFAVTMIVFTVIIKLLMLPLMIKQQKSMAKTYLVEGTDHNFLAVTNNEDLLNSILQVQ